MRTLNSGKGIFGPMRVHDKEIYVDTNNGTGFREVIETMMGTIVKNSNWHSQLNNLEYEDAYQDVCVFVLDGILKYLPNKGASLSSFLYKFVRNKIIDYFRGKRNVLCDCFKPMYNDDFYGKNSNVLEIVELMQRVENWNGRWRNIIFRVFVKGETISDVASSEGMTRWGLTRAMREKFKEARNI